MVWKVLTITRLQSKLILKSGGFLVAMLVLPLAFIAVFALSMSGSGNKPLPVAVVDADRSFASGRLVAALAADAELKAQLADAGQIAALLADHQVAAAIVIPSGFEDSLATGVAPGLQITSIPGADLTAARLSLSRAADTVATNFRIAVSESASPAELPRMYAAVTTRRAAITVDQTSARGERGNLGLSERSLGFIVMFVVMAVLMLGGSVPDDRQLGTWNRMLISATGWPAVLGGYLLSFMLAGAVQFAGLALLSRLAFHTIWGDLGPLAAMVAATVFCAAAFSLFLACVLPAQQHRTLAMLVAVVTSMLGGTYWSLDLVGTAMRRLGHLMPQAWAMDGFRAVALRGGHWAEVAVPLAVLVACGLALAVAGAWKLGRNSVGGSRPVVLG